MEDKELIIRAVETDGKVRVGIKGFASDRMLIVILNDVIEQLYKRTAEKVLDISKT